MPAVIHPAPRPPTRLPTGLHVAAIAALALLGRPLSAAGPADVPVREPGTLSHTYYDKRLLPKPILDENNRRFARHLEALARREQERLAVYRRLTDGKTSGDSAAAAELSVHIDRLREQLIDSLGVHGPSAKFSVRDAKTWRWMTPIRTNLVEVEGVRVPRNSPQRKGLFEEVALVSEIGDVTALLVRARNAKPPYATVVCLPDVDAHTGLAGRKENLVAAPPVQALLEAGLLVVAVDLPALCALRDTEVKKAFLLGEPPLGRMAAQLSVVVSYLQTRTDLNPQRIALHGRGLGGFAAALAASIDPRIWAVAVEDGLRSYRRIAANGADLDVPWLLPRMLTYADAPDLVALIAPRPMLLIETGDAAAAWSSVEPARAIADSVYRFHGAPQNFRAWAATDARESSEIVDTLRRQLALPEQPWERSLRTRPTSTPRASRPKPVSISEINSAAEWAPAKARILAEVKQLLGGFPDRGADHSGQIVECGREADFTWERVFVRTTPETLTPILITRSEKVAPRAPALIHISGSSISHEDDALRLAGEMARHGFVGVFACLKSATNFRLGGTPKDALGIVEGRPIVGEWAWNLMGLVDYLETRPDIDRNRIGAMGWSLGATTITYLLPFDERIKAGAGFVAFFQLKGIWDALQTSEIVGGEEGMPFLERHLINSFVPGILRTCDVDDLLATVAPRPLLSLAGEKDEYFPIASVRDAYARQHRLLTLLGMPDRIELLTYPGAHAMAPPLREKAWEFFGRWLR